MDRHFEDVRKRFDETMREMDGRHERTAKLKGSLDGFPDAETATRRETDADHHERT